MIKLKNLIIGLLVGICMAANRQTVVAAVSKTSFASSTSAQSVIESATSPVSSSGVSSDGETVEPRSSLNTLLEAINPSELDLEPISFIISRVDIGTGVARNLSAIPIIMSASAQLTAPHEKIVVKRKKNFSKIAKTIILATKNIRKKTNNGTKSTAELATTTITTPFDIDSFCLYKEDDLYPDPTDCQNFVICYAGKPFKTSCASGTYWNHHNKDCDYQAKVDCQRKPPTTTTTTTTTTTNTTVTQPSTTSSSSTRNKLTSYYLLPQLTTRAKLIKSSRKHNLLNNQQHHNKYHLSSSLSSTIRTNIFLATIIIPSTILVIVIIGTTLWYFGHKSKLEQKRLELMFKRNKNHPLDSKADEILTNSTNSSNMNNGKAVARFNPSCIYKKLNTFSYKFQKPDHGTMATSSTGKYASIFHNTTKSNFNNTTTTQNPTTANYKEISTIGYSTENRSFFHDQECQIATESRSTFASHFEDNNWDYNFATRGLYFSQPWVRGRYTHTLGSESMPNSGALTLDPATDFSESAVMTCANDINKAKAAVTTKEAKNEKTSKIEMYGNTSTTDSEGYYA